MKKQIKRIFLRWIKTAADAGQLNPARRLIAQRSIARIMQKGDG